jgi:hypothetical protein
LRAEGSSSDIGPPCFLPRGFLSLFFSSLLLIRYSQTETTRSRGSTHAVLLSPVHPHHHHADVRIPIGEKLRGKTSVRMRQ